jgi:hypothetical protein
MNKRIEFSGLIFFMLLSSIFSRCRHEVVDKLPVVKTAALTEITSTTAKSGGIVISDGGASITSKGVCWSLRINPDTAEFLTSDGEGFEDFASTLTGLSQSTEYNVRSYATNLSGTAYGENIIFKTLSAPTGSQIIADHTIVDKYDDIPQYYINEVKKMWVNFAGESHSSAYRGGLVALEALDPKYAVYINDDVAPAAYTTSNLRANRATWGNYDNASGWVFSYGEEDWWTNATAIARTKAGITYCNTHGLTIGVLGFAWCGDMLGGYLNATATTDPVYGCNWFGKSIGGPDGNKAWGLDAEDYAITANAACLDTYLSVTQEYIDYCTANGYSTRVVFTTGPVDYDSGWIGVSGYNGHLKHERIRDYVAADETRILFDYADILCYDDDGTPATTTYNGHTYPIGTELNTGLYETGHITKVGALRLAKAQWWLLARIAGWDGN